MMAPKVLGEATTVIYNGILKGASEMKLGMHLSKYPIDFTKIGQIVIAVLVMYALSGLFSFVQQVMMTRISQRVVYQLRQDFKSKMSRLPVSFYDTHPNGDIMSRMVNDMDNISGTLQNGMIQIITSALTFVGVLALMISISWKLTLVALITVPLSLVIIGFVAPTAQRLFGRQQAVLGKINAQVEETYAGHTIVRTFNREAEQEAQFEEKNTVYYQAAWKAQFFSILMYPAMAFVRNLGYLMVAVVGALQVANGQIALGNVQAFLQYTNQFSQPITQIASLASTIQQTIASAERIFEVLDQDEMDTDLADQTVLPGPQPKVEFNKY